MRQEFRITWILLTSMLDRNPVTDQIDLVKTREFSNDREGGRTMTGTSSSVKVIVAIVIICAAGFAIWQYGLKENPGSTPEQVTFICASCGEEFQVETEAVNELRDKETGMVKCPECGTFTGAPGTRCIHCRKYDLE